MNDQALKQTSQALMTAVIRSGCIREGEHHDADIILAVKVLREELKCFLGLEGEAAKYEDERALAMTAGSGLAMASLTAECIRRIVAERNA